MVHSAKPDVLACRRRIFLGTQQFQGNLKNHFKICGFCILHELMSPLCFFFKIPSCYSFLKSMFSNISNMYGKKYNELNINVVKSLRIFQLLK